MFRKEAPSVGSRGKQLV